MNNNNNNNEKEEDFLLDLCVEYKKEEEGEVLPLSCVVIRYSNKIQSSPSASMGPPLYPCWAGGR